MAEIIVRSKKYGVFKVLIDDEDFERVNKYKWYLKKCKNTFYVRAWMDRLYTHQKTLHRFILKAKKGQIVDHKDGNGLNNKRSNLRFCNPSSNNHNSLVRKSNRTGYKGVAYKTEGNFFTAQIGLNYKVIHLGSFKDPKKAALAYNEAAIKYHGEFAKLNKI